MATPKHRWEARYARLVVKVVMGGIVAQNFQEQVWSGGAFQGVMDDPETLFDTFDELTPVQAAREEEQAAMKE